MPTGYTAIIDDDENVTFRDYALRCARAFGALLHMRDDPLDKPIVDPEEESYYKTQLAKAEARLVELRCMSFEQGRVLATAERDAELKRREESRVKELAIDARYDAMRAEVEKWEPPTADHVGLKAFMLEQLSTGRPDYCRYKEPKPLPEPEGAVWLAEQIKRTEESRERYREEVAKEQSRNADRSGWIKALFGALPR